MEKPEIKIFDTGHELVESLSEHLKSLVDNAKGNCYVALSGGSTPKLWFEHLAGQRRQDIDWKKIHFFWGDERCVPHDDPESNYGVCRQLLLENVPIPQENIHPVNTALEPKEAARDYQKQLLEAFPGNGQLPVFDLIILGLGEDGHTASIFPWEIELWDADQLCVVGHHPDSGQSRVSFTGQLINNAKEVIFLVMGAGKADKVADIVYGKPAAAKYPASRVNPTSGNLIWYLDHAAAGKI